MPTPTTITATLKQQAHDLGFELTGVCRADSPAGAARLDEWLAAGYAGQMNYLAERRDAYHDPQLVLEGARSVLMLGMAYRSEEPNETEPGQGRVSRYAWGESDYHTVIRDRLHQLADELKRLVPEANTRCVVDTAPLLERDFAQLAGLGWQGKNTLLLNKPHGSYFFLAGLLTDVELVYDEPFAADHCGTCTACLDACPTDAFPQAYVLDASKCISYLTIELRDHTPVELRAGIGDWLFGCDECQEVCPWNGKRLLSEEAAFAPLEEMNPVDLAELFELDDAAFRARYRATPIWRAHREGLLRNAAIVLGNHPAHAAMPALIRGMKDPHPLVRGASAWALGNYPPKDSMEILSQCVQTELDRTVLSEIESSLAKLRSIK